MPSKPVRSKKVGGLYLDTRDAKAELVKLRKKKTGEKGQNFDFDENLTELLRDVWARVHPLTPYRTGIESVLESFEELYELYPPESELDAPEHLQWRTLHWELSAPFGCPQLPHGLETLSLNNPLIIVSGRAGVLMGRSSKRRSMLATPGFACPEAAFQAMMKPYGMHTGDQQKYSQIGMELHVGGPRFLGETAVPGIPVGAVLSNVLLVQLAGLSSNGVPSSKYEAESAMLIFNGWRNTIYLEESHRHGHRVETTEYHDPLTRADLHLH